jgi:hypothetical protein
MPFLVKVTPDAGSRRQFAQHMVSRRLCGCYTSATRKRTDYTSSAQRLSDADYQPMIPIRVRKTTQSL